MILGGHLLQIKKNDLNSLSKFLINIAVENGLKMKPFKNAALRLFRFNTYLFHFKGGIIIIILFL